MIKQKYWFYYNSSSRTFHPKHGAFCSPYDCNTQEELLAFWEKHLVPHSEVRIDERSRYLISTNSLTTEVISLGSIFTERLEHVKAGKTPPYSALVIGKFYKWNSGYYYEGGFSIV